MAQLTLFSVLLTSVLFAAFLMRLPFVGNYCFRTAATDGTELVLT